MEEIEVGVTADYCPACVVWWVDCGGLVWWELCEYGGVYLCVCGCLYVSVKVFGFKHPRV